MSPDFLVTANIDIETRETRVVRADFPATYVFCICLLTNKYQKYKSVELGDLNQGCQGDCEGWTDEGDIDILEETSFSFLLLNLSFLFFYFLFFYSTWTDGGETDILEETPLFFISFSFLSFPFFPFFSFLFFSFPFFPFQRLSFETVMTSLLERERPC